MIESTILKFHEARFGVAQGFLLVISEVRSSRSLGLKTVWIFPVPLADQVGLGCRVWNANLGAHNHKPKETKDSVGRSVVAWQRKCCEWQMRSHSWAWRVECRYTTGLGHEHTIRYTVCLWITFASTEKGDHLYKCASSSHRFQALICSNVTLFRSSKHSVVCTTDLSAGWVSPDAWQPGQV